MSAPAIPTIPPRPSKGSKSEELSPPEIPARPTKKTVDRSISPNPDRFAQSPLRDSFPKGQQSERPASGHSYRGSSRDPVERARSVDLPSLGEEGSEYGAYDNPAAEQTRTVADNLTLHAPKPSLSASDAKERVRSVTRTDSDKAASFGIGRSSTSEDRPVSRPGIKREGSYARSIISDAGTHTDDEQGIPEIGHRVPMNRHLGDVQAPSNDLGTESPKKNHHRRHSSRNLPPGSYGLHGHGVESRDDLEKAYYEKHPELKAKEHHHPVHERQNDFAMSSSELNKLVKSNARPVSVGASDMEGTPSEDVGYHAAEKYTSRMASPRPAADSKFMSKAISPDDDLKVNMRGPIHVDEGKHHGIYSYGDEPGAAEDPEAEYGGPILASDEIEVGPDARAQHPAIHPHHDRSDSYEGNPSPVRPVVRPPVIHRPISEPHFASTPLDDVREYEPLFPDQEKKAAAKRQAAEENKLRHHFPSKDIWEDAPNSVHYTVEVSTPEVEESEGRRKSSSYFEGRPITPAQAFAQYQEQLAEKEARSRSNNFLPLSEDKPTKPTWIDHQTHLGFSKPASSKRFPSRDVWEDAPESHIQEATVSDSQEAQKPEIPLRPVKSAEAAAAAPRIPDRPKPRQNSGDAAAKQAPPVTDKPKPQIPARPARLTADGKVSDAIAAKSKPPVPSRPVGGKIAALQAGFMSDLNKRLQIGPKVVKPEDEEEEKSAAVAKEKVPLTDARKGRARGPQRRAPARAVTPSADATKAGPTLSFSVPQASWSIDPEQGDVNVHDGVEDAPGDRVKDDATVSAVRPEVSKTSEEEVTRPEAVTEVAKSPDEVTEPASVPEVSKTPEDNINISAVVPEVSKSPEDGAEPTVDKAEEDSAAENAKEEPVVEEKEKDKESAAVVTEWPAAVPEEESKESSIPATVEEPAGEAVKDALEKAAAEEEGTKSD